MSYFLYSILSWIYFASAAVIDEAVYYINIEEKTPILDDNCETIVLLNKRILAVLSTSYRFPDSLDIWNFIYITDSSYE